MDKEKKVKISEYKKNAFSYKLLLLAVVFEMAYTIIALNNMKTNYKMGVVILVNIVLIFTMFSCAVKLNVYDKLWVKVGAIITIYCVVRAVVFIPMFIKPTGSLVTIMACNIIVTALFVLATLDSQKIIVRREHILKLDK